MIPDVKFISKLVADATAAGAALVLKEVRPKKDLLTLHKAGVEYGESDIRALLDVGSIKPYKVGKKEYISRAEIAQAYCQSSVQLLFIKMHHDEESREQPSTNKRRVGIVLGREHKARKG